MWKKIWQSKGKDLANTNLTLLDLMRLDGYDTSETLTEESFVNYTKHIADSANLANDKSILEIGCGGGLS